MMKLCVRAHDLGVKGEEKIIGRLDELGLDGIQLVAYKALEGISYTPDSMTRERAEEFRTAFAAAGKTVPLIGAYFNPVHPNVKKIENGIAVFKSYLALANTLGCGIVGSETGSYNGEPWIYHPQNRTEEALDRVVDTFSQLCDHAEEQGAAVGIEGAFGHVCYDVKTLARAVKRIGRSNIRIIFDLYNYLDASNVQKRMEILREGLETFGDRICVFHLKDCTVAEDGSLKQCGVGKGIFDYPAIIGEIKKVCPDANLVFEGVTGDDLPFAAEYIKKLIA